jgi:zinc transport system permease protein
MAGLYLSYRFDLTSGAAIIMVAGTVFLITLGIEKLWGLRPRPVQVRHAGDVKR